MCMVSLQHLNVDRLRLDGPMAWTQIKNRRLNPFGGSGPGVSKSRVERAVNIYEEIRRMEPDRELQDKSLLIMTCKVHEGWGFMSYMSWRVNT